MLLARNLKTSLKSRLLFYVWLVSSGVTFVFTSVQLFIEYKKEQNNAYGQIEVVRRNYLPSISKSVWDYSENYLQLQMQSLENLPHISYISVTADNKILYERSLTAYKNDMITDFPLVVENNKIGLLKIGLDIDRIQSIYLEKALSIFLTQAIKTMIVCFLLLKIFELIIMKYLLKVFKSLQNFDLNDGKVITLNRDPSLNDEFTLIINQLNDLKRKLSLTNQSLENKVIERTKLLDEERAKSINASRLASLGEMAGGIAHEINNPLAIISLSTLMLKKAKNNNKLTDQVFEQNVTNIDNTLFRISKIISGLRIVSRDSSEFKKEPSNLNHILEDVLGLCSEKFRSRGIDLKINMDSAKADRVIHCDRVQLSQVLINLLGNSYDAIENLEQKWIKIDFETQGNDEVIRITDSGNGIPAEITEKMFNPFYTSKSIGKGTGLGLSISRGILEKHGGTLEFDSNSSNTSFILKVPGLS